MIHSGWLRLYALAGVAVLVVAVVGCAGGGGAQPSFDGARLEGAVTLDGKPIENGRIQFVSVDHNDIAPIDAPILEGRYVAAKVPKGKVKAILNVDPPAPPAVVGSDYQPPKTVTIPDRYKNGIPIEVTADKADQDFALSSKK